MGSLIKYRTFADLQNILTFVQADTYLLFSHFDHRLITVISSKLTAT